MRRKTTLRDALLIFVSAAILILPLFRAKYVDQWSSIESTFIADARFLKENWPHPNWQPLWYGGTRFDFIYPPALRYGTAALARYYPRMTEARAYHLYTAFFYCLGIAGVYIFVATIGGRRWTAGLAAVGCALLSPSFLFLTDERVDSGVFAPQRLGVLLRYGEGPHITAVSLLPWAMAAAFRALSAWRPSALAGAGLLAALVVSNNFYGATSLAFWFPVLVWAVWVTHGDHLIFVRAAAIAALAYGLTAFWLTPAYLRVTLDNLKLVAKPGNALSVWVLLTMVAVYLAFSFWLARGKPDRIYPTLLWGTLLVFSFIVLGHRFFNFRIMGEPARLVPELDMALVLAGAEVARWWCTRPVNSNSFRGSSFARALTVAVLAVCFWAPSGYYLQAWTFVRPYANYQDRIEYRLSEWMWLNHPQSRTFVTGSARFWYNAWFDLPQMGGGSEQGLINQRINQGFVRVKMDDNVARALPWLQAFGVDFVVSHEAKSQEIYKDIAQPRKFSSEMTQIYDDGEGNLIYQVPRRSSSWARVVDTQALLRIPELGADENQATVVAYRNVLENGPASSATLDWEGTDGFRLRARMAPGQSLVAMVTYDSAFHAYAGGRPVPIQSDALGQMHILAPPGDVEVRVVFEVPAQTLVGRALTGFSLLLVAGLFAQGVRGRT